VPSNFGRGGDGNKRAAAKKQQYCGASIGGGVMAVARQLTAE